MTSKAWGLVAYGLPGVAVGLVVAWWGGGQGPVARAQAAQPPAAVTSNGTIAFTTTSNGSAAQMLYLIDTTRQAFAVYHVDPNGLKGGGIAKLAAARQYKWDLQVSEFNNQAPETSAIEAIVKSLTTAPTK